jgi:acetoin utilization deacetylase AcuC-like enzyme
VGSGLLRQLLRASRRALYRLRGGGFPLVYHGRYRQGVFGVPLDPLRGEKVLAALAEAGYLRPDLVSEPEPASLENLLRVHTPEYLHELQDASALTRILGVEVSPAEAEGTLELQRLMAGGTIHATRLAMRTGGVAVHLGGGFHHAQPGAGLGFCVFNDVAVAIRRLRARGFDEPVLVVDLDLHDGNGTRRIFADDPSVHTFSIHNDHWGDTEAVASTSIALGADVADAAFLSVLRESLPPVFDRVRPGLVTYLAGTDPAAGDPVGNWRLSAEALLERDRFVTALVRSARRPLPLVVLLAGGYGPRAWSMTARYLLWLASGRALEPIAEDELALARFRARRSELRRAEVVDDGLAFTLSEEDIAVLAPGAARPARFLGLFARHGLELVLERAGILSELRSRGFRRLRVDLVAQAPSADAGGFDAAASASTLRITAEDRGEERLVELRAHRSRSLVPEMELLAIDWLLLQNPREAFSPKRPRLPGQQHPGLGLLREVMGWMVMLCESHGLDGIYFMTAHYHVAMQSRRLVRPLDPEDEARLRALAAAFADVPLCEATRAVEAGEVVDASGAPAAWEPVASVLPVSERLLARVSGPAYEEAVARAGAGLEYVAAPRRATATSAHGT